VGRVATALLRSTSYKDQLGIYPYGIGGVGIEAYTVYGTEEQVMANTGPWVISQKGEDCFLKDLLPSGSAIWTHYLDWALTYATEADARKFSTNIRDKHQSEIECRKMWLN
jgi:hypothetical protein